MNRTRSGFLLGAFGVAVAIVNQLFANTAAAAIIRDFESVPSGDTVVAGGVLSGPGSPGSPVQQFNNTAVNGFGSQDATTGAYNGSYKINGNNLVNGMGAAFTDFTLVYAYKPDVPNLAAGNALLVRQLRMFDFSTNVTLEVRMNNQRPNLFLNNTAVSGPAIGNANFANRLMDGDPNTTVNPSTSGSPTGSAGTFATTNPTEWTFYAATYHAVDLTHVQVTEYGMTQSSLLTESNPANALRAYTSGISTNLVANSTLSVTSVAFLELGNATFGGGNNRPYDGSFDAFGFYPSVLSVGDITNLGLAALTVPEPASWLLLSLALVSGKGLLRQRRRVN
jgi:hypothetical protein